MKYRKSEAKEYAKKKMKGIWGASCTPFTPDYKVDEAGFRHNMRHCIDNLEIDGMFLNGLMGESFYQTVEERKRVMKIAVEEARDDMVIMPYTADSVLENTLELTRYAEDIGADFVIIINPKFYFHSMTPEGVFQYFKHIADKVNIGVALFNQMEHGYFMSPQLVSRIADIENVVAIKHAGPSPEVFRTRILAGDRILVSTPFEENWFMDLTVKDQQFLIGTPKPFVLQSKKLKLIKEYTELAIKGEITKAWEAYKRLEPARKILQSVTPVGKEQATFKYWTQFLGMVGGDGRVRLPQMELTEAEKQAIKAGVESTELV